MSKEKVQELLSLADVKINGDRPWDVQVHNEKFYDRIFAQGTVGVGEAYMDGWWDVEQLDEFFHKVLRAKLQHKVKTWSIVWNTARAVFLNTQTRVRSKKVAQEHYDLGNEFYENMLDKNMQYTCAYWKNAKNLDEAQEATLS